MESKNIVRTTIFGFVGLLTLLLSACQMFDTSVLAPTNPPKMESTEDAATLPPLWTPTPAEQVILPTGTFFPPDAQPATPGPDWVPPSIEEIPPEYRFEIGEFVNFVKAEDDYLIVGDNSGTMTIMDLFDPSHPEPLANVYLGYENRILTTEPGDPFSMPGTNLAAEVRDIDIEDNLLYVMTIHRFIVIDINDPTDPIILGQTELPPRLNDFEVVDGFLWTLVSDGIENRVRVLLIDARDPRNISIVEESFLPDTTAGRARMFGDLVYVTHRKLEVADQLELFSILEPGSPVKMGEVFGAPAFRAWMDDEFAYISTARIGSEFGEGFQSETASIWIVDIADPEDPTSHGFIWAPEIATDLHLTEDWGVVIGGSIYSAFGTKEDSYWMVVADLTDPENPLVPSTLELPGQALHLTGARGFTYVAAGQGGLQILRPEIGEALLVLAGQELEAGYSVSAALPVMPEPTSDPRASSTPIIRRTTTPTPKTSLFLTRTPTPATN